MESHVARFSPRNHRYWDQVLKILTHDRMILADKIPAISKRAANAISSC